MPWKKSQSKSLKKAIFKEIREDNLRLCDPRRLSRSRSARYTWIQRNLSSRFLGLALAAAAGLTFYLISSILELPDPASKLQLSAGGSNQLHHDTLLPQSNSDSANEALLKLQAMDHSQNLTMGLETALASVHSADTMDYNLLIDNTSVRLTTLFGLGIRTIVIDPGHGGRDPGAIGTEGTMEKEITLDVARRLKECLEKRSAFNIFLTREKDETLALSERVQFANTVDADLFVSIHVNSIPEARINAIETYYFGPPSDEKTLRLAQRENADSLYSSADFKKLIQKIGNTLKQQESIVLAIKIQRSLFSNIRKYDKDVHNWGVKVAPFMVLLGVECPAVLTEISCISEMEEEKKLNDAQYREKIASYIENGIVTYLIQKQAQAQRGEKNEFEKEG